LCDGEAPSWQYIDLDAAGDAVQVRAPDKSLHHGLTYGSFTGFPTMSCGALTDNVSAISAGKSIDFDCGDWTDLGNYFSGDVPTRTPGEASSIRNLVTIAKIRTGVYDYTDPTNIAHCIDGAISELPTTGCAIGPGLVINELSIGNASSGEWVELLVLGDPADPLAHVDLEGWLIDDNNGDFEGSATNVGISQGAMGLGSHWDSIAPGSIILIYDEANRDGAIPPDDVYDDNSDGVYIIPGNHWSVYGCVNVPTPDNPSYIPCPLGGAPSWDLVRLKKAGDAFQIRMPDATFFQGFSFGNVTDPYPVFPCLTFSWNLPVLSFGGIASFQCSDWTVPESYTVYDPSGATPAAVNSRANLNLVTNIRIGEFDYADLTSSANCIYEPPCYLSAVTNQMLTGYDHIRYFEIDRGTYVNTSIDALEYNPLVDSLFGADGGTFIYVNKEDAASASIGQFNPTGSLTGALGNLNIDNVTGIAFDPIARIWFGVQRLDEGTACGQSDVMFQFDGTTGEFISGAFGGVDYVVIDPPSGDNCLTMITDLAYDAFNEKLYGVAIGEGAYAGSTRIVEIDPATGNTTDLGVIQYFNGATNTNVEEVHGFSITVDGRFFISTGASGATANTLFELNNLGNPSGTILAVELQNLIFDDYQAIACQTLGTLTTIGRFVFRDENYNSQFDSLDTGIENVEVQLVRISNGEVLSTTTTDASGYYEFANLFPSGYRVEVLGTNFDVGSPLYDHEILFDLSLNFGYNLEVICTTIEGFLNVGIEQEKEPCPAAPASCTYTYSGGPCGGTYTLEAGETLCISSGTFTCDVTFNGGTVYVAEGATFAPLNTSVNSGTYINCGTFAFSSSTFDMGTVIQNYGDMSFRSDLTFRGTNLTAYAGSSTYFPLSVKVEDGSQVVNSGRMVCNSNVTVQDGSFTNHYQLTIANTLIYLIMK